MRRPALSVLALSILLPACSQAPQEGETLYVVPPSDGEWDDYDKVVTSGARTFTSIQAAIDAASSGDTVAVPSGTYVENLTGKSGVTVDGAGRGETLIAGTVDLTGVASVTLSDMSFFDPTWAAGGTAYTDHGILVDGVYNVVIDRVGVYYFDHGIRSLSSTAITIRASVLAYNWYATVDEGTFNLIVVNNLIASNAAGGTVTSDYGDGTTAQVLFNTVIGNGFAGTSHYLTGGISMGPGGSEVVNNNIITSNYYGLNCYGCDSAWSTNLVWGNTTDYVNDAYDTGSDLSVDPQFNDAGEGDFTLSTTSPCIDAGTATNTYPTDFQGESRPQGAAYDVGMDEFASSAFELQITEVIANASTESTGEAFEIYNAGATATDLDGLVFTDGDDIDTLQAWASGSTSLLPGEYAVVVDSDYDGVYGLDGSLVVMTVGDTNMGNGLTTSDSVTLYEADGSTIIAEFSHPKDPGDGVSMEMVDLLTGDAAGNWRESQCGDGHSLGAENCFPPSGDPAELVITEIMANPLSNSTGEYVELYNPTTTDIDAGGLVLADSTNSDTLTGFQSGSTLIGPGDHALIIDDGYAQDYYLPNDIVLLSYGASLGNGLSTTDTVTLYEGDGATVIDTFSSPANYGSGIAIEKLDYALGDTAANWQAADTDCARGASPGRLNGGAGGVCDPILITEVMANPLDEDTGEFVELYNAGSDTVDLSTLTITDGDQEDVIASFEGGSTLLAPGSYALVIDAEYADDYALDASLLLVTTGDTTLGNAISVSNEVWISESGHLVDAYVHPQNPGNGFSVERVSYYAYDEASNWVPSVCASGSSPGVDNCASTSSTGTSESTWELIITEVMSNPLDEGTGEYVEVYNAGTTDIDLLYVVLYDGDAADTVFGFSDPYDTVLPAGGYAVILDADYAGEYSIPADALLLVTDDSTVGSGLATNDEVYLFESDASSLIDSYTHPLNAGNGTSVERVDYDTGDVSSNWSASGCTATPGEDNCQ